VLDEIRKEKGNIIIRIDLKSLVYSKLNGKLEMRWFLGERK